MTRPLAALFALGLAAAQVGAQASLLVLPPMYPNSASMPRGIAPDNSVVVGQGFDGNYSRGFMYSSGGLAALPYSVDPNAVRPEVATGVTSGASVIVGYGGIFASDHVGFIWTPGGGTRALPQTQGTLNAFKVSADGNTVVGNFINASGVWFPARYDVPSGTVQTLSGMQSLSGLGVGVSDDGSKVAGWVRSGANERAFHWSATGGVTLLPFLISDPNNRSYVGGITPDGAMVVGSVLAAANGNMLGYRWSQAAGLQTLPLLPGTVSGGATGVSAGGQFIVGLAQPASGDGIATLWDEAHGTRSLISVALGLGLPLSGWSLYEAPGISADGTWITAGGIDPQGHAHGLLIHIPEPGSAVVMLAGAGFMRRRRGGKARA